MTLVLAGGLAQREGCFSGGWGLSKDPLMLAGVSLCPRTLQPAGDGGLVPSEWSLSQGAGSQADWIPVGVVPLPRVASNATPSGMLPSSELRLPSLECGAGSTHRDVVPPTPLPHAHHQPTSEASVRGRCSPSLLALMASGHCHLYNMKDSSVEGWRNKEVRGGQKKKRSILLLQGYFLSVDGRSLSSSLRNWC